MNLIEFMREKKIFYLILGFIFSIPSVGRFNFPLFIFIWPYCFLIFLHQNKSKIIPMIVVSIFLIASNMLRWIGIYNGSLYYSFVAGLYFSIIYFLYWYPSLNMYLNLLLLLIIMYLLMH